MCPSIFRRISARRLPPTAPAYHSFKHSTASEGEIDHDRSSRVRSSQVRNHPDGDPDCDLDPGCGAGLGRDLIPAGALAARTRPDPPGLRISRNPLPPTWWRRGLLTTGSFSIADQYNYIYQGTLATNPWFTTVDGQTYNPLTQDTPGPASLVASQDWHDPTDPAAGPFNYFGATAGTSGGYGLPFAYDPLWRFQVQNPNSNTNSPQGYYLNDNNLEARFRTGLGYIRNDPSGGLPAPHGLQRLTNFNRPFVQVGTNQPIAVMPVSNMSPRRSFPPRMWCGTKTWPRTLMPTETF